MRGHVSLEACDDGCGIAAFAGEHGTQFTVRLPLSTAVRLSGATLPEAAQERMFNPPRGGSSIRASISASP